MSDEVWRPVVIEASSCGRVRVNGRVIKSGQVRRDGYLFTKIMTHRLVAQAFHGSPPEHRPFVNHIDGDRQNNAADNLEWCSPRENSQRAVYRVRGCRHHNSSLTEIQVRDIFGQRPAPPPSLKQLAKSFGVSHHALIAARTGKNWKAGSRPSNRAILTREQVEQVRGYDYDSVMHRSRKLAAKYGVSQSVIQNIWNGHTYSSVR